MSVYATAEFNRKKVEWRLHQVITDVRKKRPLARFGEILESGKETEYPAARPRDVTGLIFQLSIER
jgi:hypothetical protein